MADCEEPRCHDNKRVLCRHRFDLESHLVPVNGFLSELELTDYQVVLYFLYLIHHNKIPRRKNSKYVIVTRDKSFLRSAQNEREKKKKKNSRRPSMEFGRDFVRSKDVTIEVEEVDSLPYGRDKHAYRKELIQQLNKRYGQKTS